MTTLLLLRGDPDRVRPPRVDEDDRVRDGGSRIRCPRCGYEPSGSDRWFCTCLHSWNTFDTHGVCPACGRAWEQTCCPRCAVWSPHAEWYTEE